MNTLSIRLTYRPIRIGWCVHSDDREALQRAARLSFTIWGGRFNPIIPVDNVPLARNLVKLFRVDALLPISSGDQVTDFVGAHPHLPWPMDWTELFTSSMTGGKSPTVVDINHPVMRLHGEAVKNNPNVEPLIELYEWEADDPLSDVLLATFGAFPSGNDIGIDYTSFVQSNLIGIRGVIAKDHNIPPFNPARETIGSLNRQYISRRYHKLSRPVWPGLYVGRADDLRDLINFWNLRAADVPVQFFDPRYASRLRTRLEPLTHQAGNYPNELERGRGLPIWHQPSQPLESTFKFLGNIPVVLAVVDDARWNERNLDVPTMFFGQATTLATIDSSGKTPAVSFALPDKPFQDDDRSYYQHYVTSIDPSVGLFRDEQATLRAPFIPSLNNFYARAAHNSFGDVRSEPDGLGVVASLLTENETLNSLNTTELIAEIFETVGIEASISKPGRVAATLLRQMSGLMGCRTFKIEGVRALIERHRPYQAFSRSDAMQVIRGQGDIRPLSKYQQLYIEPRKLGTELKNSDVLSHLLEKGVFRAGLKFYCPSCQLDFWLSIDDAGSQLVCEYCGHGFNASPQLRDKDWAFRRSGLFGNDDHQEGAIPVLLTLQQLMTALRMEYPVFTTAMSLKSKGASISDCETDFVLVAKGRRDDRIQVAIGECKNRGSISSDDVKNLLAVASAFPEEAFDVYIVFAKLAEFSAEEISEIKQVNFSHMPRAIMFTVRELESNFIYERTAEEFKVERTVDGLRGMAEATVQIFFKKEGVDVQGSG